MPDYDALETRRQELKAQRDEVLRILRETNAKLREIDDEFQRVNVAIMKRPPRS